VAGGRVKGVSRRALGFSLEESDRSRELVGEKQDAALARTPPSPSSQKLGKGCRIGGGGSAAEVLADVGGGLAFELGAIG